MKLIYFLWRWSRDIRRSRLIIFAVVAAGVCTGLFNVALLALINAFLSAPGPPSTTQVASFIALCALLPLSRFVSESLLIRLSADTLYSLRTRMCRRMLSTPLRFLEDLGVHRLLATLTDDIPVIGTALITLPLLCMHGAVVAGCLVYLGWLSWTTLLGVLAFMGLGVVSYQLAVARALNHFRLGRAEWDSLFKHFRALTEGTKELKLHRKRREIFLSEQLEPAARRMRGHHVAGNMVYTAARSWGQVLVFILLGVIVLARPSVFAADPRVLIGYTLTLLYMMTPVEVLLNALPTLGRANVAARKVEELGLSLESKASERAEAGGPEARGFRQLELVGVTHSYYREGEDSNFTLGPVELAFRPGELVFLAGGNGSGKTTLAKLLTGLYAPESGEIRLDGRPVTEENREQYRQLFSVVFSDFYLFESFIGLESPGVDELASDYLKRLQLSHKVRVADGKLSTTDLSQGQRKRLALLTAYLEDRPFYVFDEWAADQDPLFKEVFYLHLLPELKARGKAVLVISHDDWYYHVADRIIKLDYGKIDHDGRLNPDAAAAVNAPLPIRP
ncbi:MAG TPA: cyclic peptide export ABC transporter [Pyrinomonadaceae bacterium]|nr:cyclic peptide export ABC transporter [Pyrinomonadaceae bacterium]